MVWTEVMKVVKVRSSTIWTRILFHSKVVAVKVMMTKVRIINRISRTKINKSNSRINSKSSNKPRHRSKTKRWTKRPRSRFCKPLSKTSKRPKRNYNANKAPNAA